MSQRLISPDDHVDRSHDREKSFPGARCHDDYDRALAGYRAWSPTRPHPRYQRRDVALGPAPDVQLAAVPGDRRGGHQGPARRERELVL
jgi:hypothetical protein